MLGATGYIGARLVPKLVEAGWHVRAVGRNPDKLKGRSWSYLDKVETVCGDVFDLESLKQATRGCRYVFYLVHSMNPQVGDFARADRLAARNMVEAAESSSVERIIYLAGLGDDSAELSHHLQSRREVEKVLHAGSVQVTVFR
ncbi:MAG: NAD(P)H-binding protein, partial [Gammaproteobacteria bacterium]|nr:NAD(P)H-binding protein [Gammaproteobacteria bacterium]